MREAPTRAWGLGARAPPRHTRTRVGGVTSPRSGPGGASRLWTPGRGGGCAGPRPGGGAQRFGGADRHQSLRGWSALEFSSRFRPSRGKARGCRVEEVRREGCGSAVFARAAAAAPRFSLRGRVRFPARLGGAVELKRSPFFPCPVPLLPCKEGTAHRTRVETTGFR